MKRRKRSVWKAGKKGGGEDAGKALFNNLLYGMEKSAAEKRKKQERIEKIEKKLAGLGYELTYADGGKEKRLAPVADDLLNEQGFTISQIKRIESELQEELSRAHEREEDFQEQLIRKRYAKIEKALKKNDLPLQLILENGQQEDMCRIVDQMLEERSLSFRQFRTILPELKQLVRQSQGEGVTANGLEQARSVDAFPERSEKRGNKTRIPSKKSAAENSSGFGKTAGIFWFGFWLLVSVAMLLIVLPIAVSQGNPIGYIVLGALFWGSIGYICFKRLRKADLADNIVAFEGREDSDKSRTAYVLLAVFVGIFGVHNFYAGYKGRATAQLLISVLSMFYAALFVWIWAVIEAIVIKEDPGGKSFS